MPSSSVGQSMASFAECLPECRRAANPGLHRMLPGGQAVCRVHSDDIVPAPATVAFATAAL